jgi:hypothetical protein
MEKPIYGLSKLPFIPVGNIVRAKAKGRSSEHVSHTDADAVCRPSVWNGMHPLYLDASRIRQAQLSQVPTYVHIHQVPT